MATVGPLATVGWHRVPIELPLSSCAVPVSPLGGVLERCAQVRMSPGVLIPETVGGQRRGRGGQRYRAGPCAGYDREFGRSQGYRWWSCLEGTRWLVARLGVTLLGTSVA